MQPTFEGPIVPPEMQRPRKAKNRWVLPAAGGLVVGLALGLGLGAATTNGASSSPLSEKKLNEMVASCGMTPDGYSILDEGAAIELDTKGEESFDSGTSDYMAYLCMLNEIGVPETTQQKIGRTRALDGTQNDSWDGLTASWSYHPDSGSNILIEKDNSK